MDGRIRQDVWSKKSIRINDDRDIIYRLSVKSSNGKMGKREAFVKYRRGEKMSEDIMKLLNYYVLRYKK